MAPEPPCNSQSKQDGFIDRAVEEFEASWAGGLQPDLDDFLPGVADPFYDETLVELIRVDIELRWERGCHHPLEYYIARYPCLKQSPERLCPIAFEDYRVRVHDAEGCSPEYYARTWGIDVSNWPRFRRQRASTGDPDFRTTRVGSQGRASFDPEKLPTVGERFEGFRLVAELGRGAFGRVYLAVQADLSNRFVVLKFTPPRELEPQHLAKLQHTNIMPIYSLHESDDFQVICMPFLGVATLADVAQSQADSRLPADGQSLISTAVGQRLETIRSRLKESEQVSEPDVSKLLNDELRKTSVLFPSLSRVETLLLIGKEIVEGLEHAHQNNILHRDLKPANILFSDHGHPLLLDFHLAKPSDPVDREYSIVGGTIPYCSPEQLRAFHAAETLDARSDIYSFGVILFRLLTGNLPFADVASGSTLDLPYLLEGRKHTDIRAALSEFPPAIRSLIDKCLQLDPADRYQTATELRIDLERQLANQPLQFAPNISWPERFQKWTRRHPKLTSMTSVAVAALVIIAGLTLSLLNASAKYRETQVIKQAQAWLDETAEASRALVALQSDGTRIEDGIGAVRQALARDLPRPSLPDRWRKRVQQQTFVTQMRLAGALLELAERDVRREAGVKGSARRLLDEALQFNRLAESGLGSPPAKATAYQRARIRQLLGDHQQAQQLADQAAATPAVHAVDSIAFAQELIRQREADRAIQVLDELPQSFQDDFSLWLIKGYAYAALKKQELAAFCFTQCIRIEPHSEWGYLYRGISRLEMQQYEAAAEDFRQVVALTPQDWNGYVNLALAQTGLGQWETAERSYTRAIELGTTHTRVYLLRARVRRQLGNESAAQADMEQGLQLTPEDEISWISRGFARAASEPDLALADFKQALALTPDSAQALQNIAAVQAEILQDPAAAVPPMDQLIELRPQDAKAWATRGVLHARLGNVKSATRDAQRALHLSQEPSTLFQVAGIFALLSANSEQHREIAINLLYRASYADPQYVLGRIEQDDDLNNLRDEQELQNLVEMLKSLHAEVSGSPSGSRSSQ